MQPAAISAIESAQEAKTASIASTLADFAHGGRYLNSRPPWLNIWPPVHPAIAFKNHKVIVVHLPITPCQKKNTILQRKKVVLRNMTATPLYHYYEGLENG